LAAVMGLTIGVLWDLISAGFFHTWFWNADILLCVMIGRCRLRNTCSWCWFR
jgi:hypothetical protein